MEGDVGALDVVVALGVVTLCPNTEGDLLGGERIEVEEAGIGAKALSHIEGCLTVDGSTLVRLPDRCGTGILKGDAAGADDIRLCAGLGGRSGGGSVLVLNLNCLTGEVDVHFLSGDEPDLKLYIRGAVGVAGRAGLALEGDTVGGGDRIEKLLVKGGRVL